MKNKKQTKQNFFTIIITIFVIVFFASAFSIIFIKPIMTKNNNSNNNVDKYVDVNFNDLKRQLTPSILNNNNVSIYTTINLDNENIVDITSFGAIANDNIDDTNAINTAINSLSNGGLVYIPNGIFNVNVNTCINLKDNITMFGNGNSSVIKLADNQSNSNNIVKIESKNNVNLYNFSIDGNINNQDKNNYTQYGLFVSSSNNCFVERIFVSNVNGVGIQLYNSENCVVNQCYSSNNKYHGFEIEQSNYCQLLNSYGANNERHGVLISPGEIGSQGSHYNNVKSCYFFENKECGISFSLANDNLGDGLSYANTITNNIVFDNYYCGIQSFKVDKCFIKDNLVVNNGGFGIYLYSSMENVVMNNYLLNNSQKSHGTYDEIRIESSLTKDSCYSTISNNTILIKSNIKARYGIHDTSYNGNYINDNVITYKGSSDYVYIVKTN